MLISRLGLTVNIVSGIIDLIVSPPRFRKMVARHSRHGGLQALWAFWKDLNPFFRQTLSQLAEILRWLSTQIAKFMGPTWGPPRSCRPKMGPMLAPWTLLSGHLTGCLPHFVPNVLYGTAVPNSLTVPSRWYPFVEEKRWLSLAQFVFHMRRPDPQILTWFGTFIHHSCFNRNIRRYNTSTRWGQMVAIWWHFLRRLFRSFWWHAVPPMTVGLSVWLPFVLECMY